jgi:outer membrane immunogenic protein
MLARSVLAFAALCALAASAQADEVAAPTLPSLALDPQLNAPANAAPDPSLWSGLTVGSEIFAISGKGVRGGVGGGGFAGYSHEFANNVVVGVQASAGYSPSIFKHSPVAGYDFASTNVEVGYDMGRLTSYMTVGVDLVKPSALVHNGFTTTSDAINDLFAGSNPKAFTTVGAGVNYAFSNNLSMGISVSVSTGNGLWGPEPMLPAH